MFRAITPHAPLCLPSPQDYVAIKIVRNIDKYRHAAMIEVRMAQCVLLDGACGMAYRRHMQACHALCLDHAFVAWLA